MNSHISKAKNAKPLIKKKKRKWLRSILAIAAFLFIFILLFSIFTPIPASLMIRTAFKNGIAVAPNNYEAIKETVTVTNDLNYPSKYKDNSADIYIPKNKEGLFPVVLWVHGGAFVGGDKRDIEIYATALASEGIAVVCINYQRAPEAKYPTPIIQMEEAYLWLKNISNEYSIDINRLILAGDSAGAHIAAQFAAIQSNTSYANEMAMNQIVPLNTIKSILLFCGPFDVAKIAENNNSLINFFMERAAWAYFGKKNWNEQFSFQATISNHITDNFPPAFITDSNTLSFEEHAKNLAGVLKKNNVPVETYFIPINVEETAHEYQFVMNTPSAEESFKKTVSFIKKYAEP